MWDKEDASQKPSLDTLEHYIASPLWRDLLSHIDAHYQAQAHIEYSGCSMQKGWNVKFKKAGRSLCTLYPMQGYFIALVVIGSKEQEAAEVLLPSFSEHTRSVYRETPIGMGQRWLMLSITDLDILHDVEQLIAIRREAGKASGKKKTVS